MWALYKSSLLLYTKLAWYYTKEGTAFYKPLACSIQAFILRAQAFGLVHTALLYRNAYALVKGLRRDKHHLMAGTAIYCKEDYN